MKTIYENRELSWLRFNERVLEEAEDERVPLCERLTFLSIFQSNLDEFFMVRIGSLHDQNLLDKDARDSKTNMTPAEQMEAAIARSRELCKRRDRVFAALMERLGEQGISLIDFHHLPAQAEKKLQTIFRKEYIPLLSAQIMTKKQPIPFLAGKEIYAVALLSSKTEKEKLGIVPCSRPHLPRLIAVPDRPGCYMLAEELILHYLPLMFPGHTIHSKTLLRVTRNADIDADAIYDEDLNYRDHMAEVVKRRKKLCPVRLELSRAVEPALMKRYCQLLNLTENQVFSYAAPLDVGFFSSFRDQLRTHADLFYAPRRPQESAAVDPDRPMLAQIDEKDILLHYPYESIRPFLRLLNEAAADPAVTAIRMTLYRLAPESKVVEALAEAAERGKRVEVLVELKARFDEENNIAWSRRLEEAGCHVIYGIEHIKVHSKLCLITRQTASGVRYITQIGTGNYDAKTSGLYTDLCYMTANQRIGEDALMVFRALLEGETVDHVPNLLVAPHCLQNKILDMIDGEIARAREGLDARIRVKINSLTDRTIIDRLIEAGKAGVRVEMIVRGINCLISGVPGETDNIHVISVVGRFLEHSRIYIFGEGERARYYISSADWMTRNTLRRVEVACPIEDEDAKRRLETIFGVMWDDNASARDQTPDGSYRRRYPGVEETRSCQNWFYDEAYRRALTRSEAENGARTAE